MSFSITRKTDYALVALARLAQAENGHTLSARQIADGDQLPLPLLMNVLKALHAAGLVESRRGAGGGYALKQTPDQICLADVMAAIEGPVAVTLCCDETETQPCTSCDLTKRCPITRTMHRFNEMIVGALQRMTLADMMTSDVQLSLHIQRNGNRNDGHHPMIEVM